MRRCGERDEDVNQRKVLEPMSIVCGTKSGRPLCTHVVRVVQLAIRAVLDEQPRETKNRNEQLLPLWIKVARLHMLQTVLLHRGSKNVVEAVQRRRPVEEIASRPAPFDDMVEDLWQILVVFRCCDAFEKALDLVCLQSGKRD